MLKSLYTNKQCYSKNDNPWSIKTVKDLSAYATDQKAILTPSVPSYAVPKQKYSDKDANSLTRAIIAYHQLPS